MTVAPVENPELKQPEPKGLLTPQLSIVLILTAIAAFLAGLGFAEITDSPYNDNEFEVFWDSWEILESEYYYDLPEETELIYGAIQGLLSTTDDRYTFFSPPSDAKNNRMQTAGEFGGIGAYVGTNQANELIITSVFDDMPAQEAGLQADDVIRAVDGVSITGLTQDDALALVRGEIGSDVVLTIYRPATNEEFDVTVTRTRVELPTVIATTYGDIGYLQLLIFNGNATSALEREIAAMQAEGIKALILDLRNNPGGLLDQAVSVSDLFLDSGVVVTQRNRDSSEREYKSDDGDLAEDIPLVVLMDNDSASASEVVAGALRDRNRAILIGQTSFGKGSVQHVFDLKDGSQIRVTAAVWFTPNETPIDGQGLTPDIEIAASTSGDAADLDDDPYVTAALDYFEDQFGIQITQNVSESE
ncbi:MAG: S41 family peptidase [Anaerolineae bacterium]|nr:S41 family peptidase [Anaerolineae bacterium]